MTTSDERSHAMPAPVLRAEYELEHDGQFVFACKACAAHYLARVPGATGHPEPASPDRPCELAYEGVCEQAS